MKKTIKNTIKIPQKLGFLLFIGAESAIPAVFFKFPIDHRKRLFSKESSA